jgi:hypothetical protein
MQDRGKLIYAPGYNPKNLLTLNPSPNPGIPVLPTVAPEALQTLERLAI